MDTSNCLLCHACVLDTNGCHVLSGKHFTLCTGDTLNKSFKSV